MAYKSLSDLRVKKDSVRRELRKNQEEIADIWYDIRHDNHSYSSKEKIANFASKAWIAYDAFMLFRKLTKWRSRRRRSRFF